MFTLYEVMGAVTNLAAGVAGAKWGIRATLISGLALQIVGLGMLYGWSDEWSKNEAIVYVTAAQALCGIAKDLTKLGGKTVTKLVTPEEKQVGLFKLVSALTGYKNSLKGVGYFMGAALLDVSYDLAVGVNIGFIVVAIPFAVFGLTTELGRVASKNITLAAVFKQSGNINYLSLARLFLFGSRDLWFEVPLPFYLRSAAGLGWPRSAVGALLAGEDIFSYNSLVAAQTLRDTHESGVLTRNVESRPIDFFSIDSRARVQPSIINLHTSNVRGTPTLEQPQILAHRYSIHKYYNNHPPPPPLPFRGRYTLDTSSCMGSVNRTPRSWCSPLLSNLRPTSGRACYGTACWWCVPCSWAPRC